MGTETRKILRIHYQDIQGAVKLNNPHKGTETPLNFDRLP